MTVSQLIRSDGIKSEPQSESSMGYLKCEHGVLPLCALAYDSTIRSLGVETRILQTFYNPFDFPIEANYIFPLDGTTAVTDCIMLVEDRVVRADLEERSVARKRYQSAIRRGKRAALLEENRSETFSLTVGNIPAGESIRVCLITVGELPVQDDQWMFRLPLVVAPRYTSGFPIPAFPRRKKVASTTPNAPGMAFDTPEVPDASQVTPARIVKGFPNSVELNISVDIDLGEMKPPGTWNEILSSSLHSVILNEKSDHCRISIQAGERVDRDFILRGNLKQSEVAVSARMDAAANEGLKPFAVHVLPPNISAQTAPRNIAFVVDKSGSMEGWKFPAAQRATSQLIESLDERDQFSLMTFNGSCEPFKFGTGGEMEYATPQHRFEASKWLIDQFARGGTEMGRALSKALELFKRSPVDSVANSIVLITDGQITGEDYVLSQLNCLPKNKRPRIFTIGVDRAVNASVLRRLSEATGGVFELAESENQLDKTLRVLKSSIEGPVLHSLFIEGEEGSDLEIAVEKNSLFKGRPVTLYGRTAKNELNLTLKGVTSDGNSWSEPVEVIANGVVHSDLLSLWGKARVRNLEDQYAINGFDDLELRGKIVRTSIETRALSRFTAYVAVDEEVVDSHTEPLRINQLVEVPEGWSDSVWATIPQDQRLSSPVVNPISKPTSLNHAAGQNDFDTVPDSVVKQIGKKLIGAGAISSEQWDEVRRAAHSSGIHPLGVLVCDLQYVESVQMARLLSQVSNQVFVDLSHREIPESMIELMPEVVARENRIFPIGENGQALVVATTSPWDVDTIEKLRFILNRDIEVAITTSGQIIEMINTYYGQFEGESADSILQEFTDTAIDFTETVTDCDDYYYLTDAILEDSGSLGLTDSTVIMDGMQSDYRSAAFYDVEIIEELQLPPESAPRRAKSKRHSIDPKPETAEQRLVKLLFMEARKLKASAICITPDGSKSGFRIDFVIDGEIHEQDTLPARMWQLVVGVLRKLAGIPESAGTTWQGKVEMDGYFGSVIGLVDCKATQLTIEIQKAKG